MRAARFLQMWRGMHSFRMEPAQTARYTRGWTPAASGGTGAFAMRAPLLFFLVLLSGCFPEVALDAAVLGAGDTATRALDVSGGSGGEDGDGTDSCTAWTDGDGDGYGAGEAQTVDSCEALPAGFADNDADCDDTDSAVHPDASEVCNGVDDDCDGDTDDADDSLSRSSTSTWYVDSDRDGYGNARDSTRACEAPRGHAANSGDCDDDNPRVSPDASEACNGIDDDCDGLADSEAVCPCSLERNRGHNYLFCTSAREWWQAESACDSETNYQLVVITDAAEQEWVWMYADAYGPEKLWWIGLHNLDASYWEEPDGSFEWVDGSPYDYAAWHSSWSSEQPDDFWGTEDCVFLDPSSGGWHDYGCEDDRWGGKNIFFICESAVD